MSDGWEQIKAGQRFMEPDVLKGNHPQGACVIKDYRRYRGTPWSFMATWLVRREARCLGRLLDTGIAPRLYLSEDPLVLAMSWQQGHRPTQGDGVALDALFEALRMAHNRGFIHNDVHASNVLVGPTGVVLLDWASALRLRPLLRNTFWAKALMRRDIAHAFKLRARTLGRPVEGDEAAFGQTPLWMQVPRYLWALLYRRRLPRS